MPHTATAPIQLSPAPAPGGRRLQRRRRAPLGLQPAGEAVLIGADHADALAALAALLPASGADATETDDTHADVTNDLGRPIGRGGAVTDANPAMTHRPRRKRAA